MKHAEIKNLWRHSNFIKLCAGQTVSLFGSQISLLAIPLTAVLILNATPLQMGILTATEAVPYLLFGLVAGVWVDRLRRRAILIVADVGRFIVLSLIPLAYLLGILRIELVYLLAFPLLGMAQLLFGLARPIFSINQISLRQTITPERLLGRMNASVYFIVFGIPTIGALLGGALGQSIGLQNTLVIAAFGELFACLWLFFSPIRK